MSRLLVKIPDLKETCDITHELENIGVSTNDIHVYSHAQEDLKKAHIHPASAYHVGNLATVAGRGLLIGTLCSSVLWTLFYFNLSVAIPTLGYAAIIGFGLGFGFWLSGLLGVEELKHFIDDYFAYVNKGHFLMMVDSPENREHELVKYIQDHHKVIVFPSKMKAS